MADTKLRITFNDIEIASDGDPVGKGQIYWNLKVDGAVVTSRSSANPLIIGSGETITLGHATTVTKSSAAGTKLTVSGSVSEKDSLDKDDTDSFTHTYTAGNDWGTGSAKPARLVDKNLNVTVNYTIDRV
ncbi:MAG: hypothetical protein DYG89_08100 [Caldilinea sp. CFX5]|nr:hypothetical protein [Caldilinea sp. CFX5]